VVLNQASRHDHLFFTGMAILAASIVFGGFARTYYQTRPRGAGIARKLKDTVGTEKSGNEPKRAGDRRCRAAPICGDGLASRVSKGVFILYTEVDNAVQKTRFYGFMVWRETCSIWLRKSLYELKCDGKPPARCCPP
jgi:hypothetical protein